MESEVESSEDEEIDSDAPSEAFEDIERSTDDDIFKNKEKSRKEQQSKLRKILKRTKKSTSRGTQNREPHKGDNATGWYSDADSDDNFDQAPFSDNKRAKNPTFKEGDKVKNLILQVGLEFPNVEVYKDTLIDWSVRMRYELTFIKCEKKRVTTKCAAEGCSWRIHASVIQNSTQFQIKSLTGEHTCARKALNRRATALYLAKMMEAVVRDNPDISIPKFISTIGRKCGLEVSYWIALRAKKAARKKIRGEDDKEYAILWDYCETVRSCNPGSKLLLKKKDGIEPPTFDRMYFSCAALKNGFLAGCRPVTGLDGCFLKTVHGGQLLRAVGRDGNDNLLPIALAFVQVENKDTWTWFISELLQDIEGEGSDKWTFVSNRQKGLIEALKDLAPECEHRYCLRHMYQNFSQKWKSVELKGLFWKAASVSNKDEHEEIMKKIDLVDPKVSATVETAVEWLRKIPPIHWARSYFRNSCKSDILVNNLCESFNNLILPARELPIVSMFEWIRARLMTRIQIKRVGMEKYEGTICPNILKKINKQQINARYCVPRWCGNQELEIEAGGDKYVVKLDNKTCTCGMFQLCGYPCSHACAAITQRRLRIDDFVHSWYTKEMYLRVYSNMIHAVPGKKHYIQTKYTPLAAPAFKTKVGRPKKLKRKGLGELERLSTRKGLTHTCSNCHELNHNKRTCSKPLQSQSKGYKGSGTSQTSCSQANQDPVVTIPNPAATIPDPATRNPVPAARIPDPASTRKKRATESEVVRKIKERAKNKRVWRP